MGEDDSVLSQGTASHFYTLTVGCIETVLPLDEMTNQAKELTYNVIENIGVRRSDFGSGQ